MPKLTTKAVEAIKPTTDRREIPDALLPGLYLIVQPSGARSWAVRYRHGDRTRKHTLGNYPLLDLKAARELGAKALRVAAEGRDPGHDKKQERGTTVEDVVAQFLDRHCRHNHSPRTLKESERLLRLYVLSRWSDRPARNISRAEVREMLDRLMADGTPVLANRVTATKIASLLDHFGASEQRWWNGEAESGRCFEIDDEFDLRRLLYRQLCGLCTL
jgi:hypothetical protein